MARSHILTALRIARRFHNPTLACYAACKIISDPVYRAVAERIGESDRPLLDLGCGMGLCPFYLRQFGFRGDVYGVDIDSRKIDAAVTVARRRGEQMQFNCNSVVDLSVLEHLTGHRGNIVMLDVLHYLEPAVQQDMLHLIAASLKPGAWAIMRITPRTNSWRFHITNAEERAIQFIGWMRRSPVYFPTIEQVAAPFEALDHACDIRPLWGRTPFNSYLFSFHHRQTQLCCQNTPQTLSAKTITTCTK